MVAGPSLTERPSIAQGCANGFVSGLGYQAIILPRPSVLADRDDRSGRRVADGGVAAAGVSGALVVGHVGCGAAAIAQHGLWWQRFFGLDEIDP
jgi:hypothetical protein